MVILNRKRVEGALVGINYHLGAGHVSTDDDNQ